MTDSLVFELLIIGIGAIVLVGPEDPPRVMLYLGNFWRQFIEWLFP